MKQSHSYAVEYKVAIVQQHIYGIYYHLQPIMTMIETSGKPRSSTALPLRRPLPTTFHHPKLRLRLRSNSGTGHEVCYLALGCLRVSCTITYMMTTMYLWLHGREPSLEWIMYPFSGLLHLRKPNIPL
jgi:hypothetical protein